MLLITENRIALNVEDSILYTYQLDNNNELIIDTKTEITSLSMSNIKNGLLSLGFSIAEESEAVCSICKKTFKTKRPTTANTCSNACRQKKKTLKKLQTANNS